METTKIKITPSAVSGSTAEQHDVAKLSFASNGIKSSLPLFVNDNRVITENNRLRYDEGQGIMRVDKMYVQEEMLVNGQKPIFQSDDMKIKDGVLSVNNISVAGKNLLFSSPDLSWDEATGTLTVKNLKVIGTMDISNA